MNVPSPADRPTEYVVSVVSAALALIAIFFDLPNGFEAAFLAFVAVLAPGVTAWVAHRRGEAKQPHI
jgi:hypothetical protein